MVDLDTQENIETILGFHDISGKFDFSINTIPSGQLNSIIDFISENKPVKISFLFDDGYASVLEFKEKLVPFQPKISIITNFIGKTSNWDTRMGGTGKSHLTVSQIRELQQSGWKILSHSHLHHALDQLSAEKLKTDLETSKKTLENITGSEITGLSLPFGRFDNRVIEIANEAGFRHFYSNKASNPVQNIDRSFSVYRWEGNPSVKRKIERNQLELLKLKSINFCSLGTVLMQKLFYEEIHD